MNRKIYNNKLEEITNNNNNCKPINLEFNNKECKISKSNKIHCLIPILCNSLKVKVYMYHNNLMANSTKINNGTNNLDGTNPPDYLKQLL